MAAEDFEFAIGLTPQTEWPAYLDSLAREHAGIELRPDRVAATFLVAVVDGVMVGRASIRHRLNDFLLAYGGHIRYRVVGEHRRRRAAPGGPRPTPVIAPA